MKRICTDQNLKSKSYSPTELRRSWDSVDGYTSFFTHLELFNAPVISKLTIYDLAVESLIPSNLSLVTQHLGWFKK